MSFRPPRRCNITALRRPGPCPMALPASWPLLAPVSSQHPRDSNRTPSALGAFLGAHVLLRRRGTRSVGPLLRSHGHSRRYRVLGILGAPLVSGLGSGAITSASSRASNILSIVLFQWSGVFLHPCARVPSWKPGRFPMAPAIRDFPCPLGGAIPGGYGYWRSTVPVWCSGVQARPGSARKPGRS